MNNVFFKAVLRFILQLCLTGIILMLAIPGYIFYGFLWVIRLMQVKRIVFIIAVLFVLGCIVSFMSFNYFFRPYGKSMEEVSMVITPGMSIRHLSDSLAQEKVIRSSKVMLVWLKFTKSDRKLQAGKVVFSRGDGVLRAAEKMLHAVAIEKSMIIIEGLTVEQTAGRIQAQLGIDSSRIVQLANDSSFISGTGVKARSLEGYLFPETYRFPEEVKAEDVLKKMVELFRHSFEKVQIDPLISSRLTVHEIITLASIVEKEATLPVERPRIAAVFHNRLRKGYPLGADPTVRYIFRKFSGSLRVSELNSDNPYNTRKFSGLPPGPICSPGLGAIKAAAAPLQSDELYFVAKWDGSGEHDFSKTNAEHDRKKITIRQENQRRLKGKRINQ
ncbi:MAG TPA: endolytic transglycosylase MltG [Chitinispirillaceae bacterium]|nr:endolytic transglycosylase MltG [Chitinispirillaceae bacterium]